jgi:Tol biopolymer transport system component
VAENDPEIGASSSEGWLKEIVGGLAPPRRPLSVGEKLGPYEIAGVLGAGGMGEVYRARDPRLGREVALKVLPGGRQVDDLTLGRFREEARAAAALSHPNLLAIHDVALDAGVPYMVFELLDGETLRQRMGREPLGVREALGLAAQIAAGLAAMHGQGIVHRDLKPENLFVTTEGRAKILDFGLAKHASSPAAAAEPALTREGTVLGTIGYMSPEQVRGAPADARSDVFAFGAVLYEMISGSRAFEGKTDVELMAAILRDDPAPLTARGRAVPPLLEATVRRCLEKKPAQRFQSVADLAFQLGAIAGLGTEPHPVLPAERRGRWRWPALLVATAVAAAALAWMLSRPRREEPPAPASFERMTYRNGIVESARFAPDNRGIVYSASWEGAEPRLFSTSARVGSVDLGVPNAEVVSISQSGEMALILRRRPGGDPFERPGVLAQAPLGGGAPRELRERVHDADFAPSGADMAVAIGENRAERIEYPLGRVLYSTAGWVSHVRISPRGDRIAFLDHPVRLDDLGTVAVVDTSGHKRTLTRRWSTVWGLAWSPSGEELWFSAARQGRHRRLRAVDLSGRERTLARLPGNLTLLDVARDGRALLTIHQGRSDVFALAPGEKRERNLAWFDTSHATGMSADGRMLLLSEVSDAAGPLDATFLRRTDGSPAIRLAEGYGRDLSPDGKWAIVGQTVPPFRLHLVPTGAGELRPFTDMSLHSLGAWWVPGGERIVVTARKGDEAMRAYVLEIAGGAPRPISPTGIRWKDGAVSPDGKAFVGIDAAGVLRAYPLVGGEPRGIPGALPGDAPARFSPDGRYLFVYRREESPVRVYRIELSRGRRELWREIVLPDPIATFDRLKLSADAKAYAYCVMQVRSDLFVVSGLR